ncbi:MAG: response regulator transcription factor [Actinomycetota bacterium]|nr:response regulator transcription factor [Actinomycetota bacterium]
MPPRSVVVVEDEAPIAAAVASRLRSEGYHVEVAHDGPSGVALCRRNHPDLVVLDLMLPGFDGFEVCRQVQEDRPTPVLMLTARDSETDLLAGLGIGADDYLTKPFSMRELVARVQAVLRRADRVEANVEQPVVRVSGIEVDAAARRVRKDGEHVHLTPTEFDLLLFLARRTGTVFTRDQLLLDVWGHRVAAGGRTVDSHVQALRRKLGAGVIRTVHGVGYAMEA